MLVLISVASVFISVAGGADIARPLLCIAVGAALIIAVSFIKEEYLHKAALIIYFAVIALLLIQLFLNDRPNTVTTGYIYFFDVYALHTSALLPLTYILSARMIGKYKTVGLSKLLLILAVMCLPIIFVLSMLEANPLVVAFFVSYITLIVMKKEKRIDLPLFALLIPIALIIIAVVITCLNSNYAGIIPETIITRGQNQPLGDGWARINLDGIFMNTPFIGATHYSQQYLPIPTMLAQLENHNIVLLLSQYGRLAFLSVLAIYVCFFVVLFKMVHDTRSSSFARYTSLMFALSLLVQAVYSLTGLFLLDKAPLDMPFVSSNYTVNVMNYLSFGIVFSLYLRRNKVSAIKEIDLEEPPHDYSPKGIIKSFKDYLSSAEAEEEEYEEYI